MFKYFTVLLVASISFTASSQKISGVVLDEKGDPLSFSSVTIKGTTQGVTANNQGKFNFDLPAGNYVLVCQHVGYAKQEKKVVLDKNNQSITFILPQQKLQLKEVIVKSGAEDPAYEIIRQAIKKRNFYKNQVNAFECEAYIKGLIKLRTFPKKLLGKKVPESDKNEMGIDSTGKGIIFLSESITKVAMQQPDKVKLEVISGRQSGSEGFGFNFPTFISLYENNVTMLAEQLNPRGFVSPIADGALNYYKYKFLGSFFEDGKEINTIRVTPKRSYEPLFSGIINITENDWRIHSCDMLLTKTSQLQVIDTLQLTQIHVPVTGDIWRVKNQLIHFNFKQFGIDAIGNFVNVYSKYNLDPQFSKKYFDRIIMKYDTSVNKKTKAYWDSVRPVSLEPEEAKDYKIKDSLYRYRKDSGNSNQNIDSLKKHQGKVTFVQVFWSGVNRTHYSKTNPYSYQFKPVLQSLQFTSVEGIVANIEADYTKFLKTWKTNLTISPGVRYGFTNHHLNAWMNITFRTRDWDIDKKLKRETWSFAGGKRVSQFNKESSITPLGNTINTLIYGRNDLKIYENYFGDIRFTKRFESGLRFSANALYEDRFPLENTNDYVFIKKHQVRLTPNYPFLIIPTNFIPHQAFIVSAEISIKPGQRYIQFPLSKIPIGSKYPTFTLQYVKGLQNVFGSDENFDKWKFIIDDDANLKLAGAIKYNVAIGGFLNRKKVFIQDYQHFNGNESHIAKEYLNTFQLADYYSLSNTASLYGSLHFEHHFNGLLTNKIPLFKRLNWNLVDGVNALYVNKNIHHTEIFAGIENIFKVLRFDVVAGFTNNNKAIINYRVGLGGILGGNLSATGSHGR